MTGIKHGAVRTEQGYAELRDWLRVRLADLHSGAEDLRDAVWQPAGCGYALVAYLTLPGREEYTGDVPKGFGEAAGIPDRQILRDARLGSRTHELARLVPIEAVLGFGEPADLLTGEQAPGTPGLLVLTTARGRLGAASLYYPGIQARIGNAVGGDYYVLPSSVHEVLILPDAGGRSPRELAGMVRDINEREVAPGERLGNRVLEYRADLDRLRVAADLDRARDRERGRC